MASLFAIKDFLMADTLPNITLSAGIWTDIYAESGIVVGTAIEVQNIGSSDVRLSVVATQPSTNSESYNIIQRANGVTMRNSSGDSGAWAMCPNSVGKINVRSVA